jgi:hypothetical protein
VVAGTLTGDDNLDANVNTLTDTSGKLMPTADGR